MKRRLLALALALCIALSLAPAAAAADADTNTLYYENHLVAGGNLERPARV